MNRDRWHRLMQAFGLPESNESFDQLLNAYSQKHRHYHTSAHIGANNSALSSPKS